ncbi:MAG TPA: hypothetical protein EYQ18_11600 [Candidatus Handelsmanbacteria bacterium]|nr:hypothetical protein [Candidatus Handelsmanbacteria bacterium]
MKTTVIPIFCALLLLLFANTATEAGGAKTWQQHAYHDFAKGKSEGVSIAAVGALSLAPALETLTELETERIWSLAHAPNGGLYAGTGDSGRLYAIEAEGQARLLFDSPELVLHTLLVGPDGALYAGSAPDGLIYKINAKGQSETFAQTGSHYVWDLAFVDGQLHAATGEPGQVLKIAKDGSHEVLFDPDDRHVMSLLAHGDRLLAGTASKGRIYEIDTAGQSRLLFEAAQEEIHDLAADAQGQLFASAIPGLPKDDEQAEVFAAVYRLEEGGAVYPIWQSTDSKRVDLAAGERLALSTSNPTRLLRMDASGQTELAVQFEDFAPGTLLFDREGNLYLGGTQKAVIAKLPGSARLQGHFESAVEDFALHTRWGTLDWRGNRPKDTRMVVQTRTGNGGEPDDTWSPWSAPLEQSGQTITSPPARFIQYRVELESTLRETSPRLDWIAVRGVQANLKPRITELQTFPFRNQQSGPGGQAQGTQPVVQGPLGSNRPPQAKSLRLVRWQAADPNEDELVYDLYLKGEDQREWKQVQENLAQTSVMWDTESMPEGWTRLKLVASDRADNPPGQSLHDERESAPFAIDNSPPAIELDAETGAHGVVVDVAISDRISGVQKAYYTVDYNDPQHPIGPLDGVFDGRDEKARFTVEDLTPGEHVISVQVFDALGNVGVRQIVVEIK